MHNSLADTQWSSYNWKMKNKLKLFTHSSHFLSVHSDRESVDWMAGEKKGQLLRLSKNELNSEFLDIRYIPVLQTMGQTYKGVTYLCVVL